MCLSKCIFRRRTVVTDVDIQRWTPTPDTCQWSDAAATRVREKLKTKYEKTEDGTCTGECHCVQDVDADGNPKPEEGPAKDDLPFDTVIRIDECTFAVSGRFKLETFDTPGRCHPNGGTVKMAFGRLPNSDMTITVENHDHLSEKVLGQIRDLLKKS